MNKPNYRPLVRSYVLYVLADEDHNIDYTYFDIEQRLKSWGIVSGDETEKQLDKKLGQYWDRIAMALFTEFNKEV